MKTTIIIFLFIPFLSISQTITTYVGNGTLGYTGDGGLATSAEIASPIGLGWDNNGNLLICHADLVRKVNSPTGIITTIAGSDTATAGPDGIPATNAFFAAPVAVCVDKAGNYYITDNWYNEVRVVNALTGIIDTFAGKRIGGSIGDGGPAKKAEFGGVMGLSIDTVMNVMYIGDEFNYKIRKVNMSTGIISTFAGTGVNGYFGDSGPATGAQLSRVLCMCTDPYGNLYLGDWDNARIRKINTSTGIITTYVGNGTQGYSGDGGPATNAEISRPTGICFDKCGNLYIADAIDNVVRKIDAVTSIISTVAGTGSIGFSGDGGPATAAQFKKVSGIAVDDSGNLFVSDFNDQRIRKIGFSGTATLPKITISASPNDTVCSGFPVTFTSVLTGGGIPIYEWFVNGVKVGATGSSYSYIPTNGDNIRCAVTTSSCMSPSYSNAIKMVVNPVVSPTIGVSASPGSTVCTGTSVTFSSSITDGGSAPVYKWYVNGGIVSGSSSYTYIPSNKDSIRCVLTSNAACASPLTLSSSTINMLVNSAVIPSISIAPSPGAMVCAGAPVTYNATIAGGGSTPGYMWYVNGSAVSTAGSSYTYIPSNNDSIRCMLTSSSACASPAVANSNTVKMVVNPSVVPTITISASPGDTVCAGTAVTFKATITNGGSSPAYQWYVNGGMVSGSSSYTYTPANGDSIRCTLGSSATCASPVIVSSSSIKMVVNPVVMPTIIISASPGAVVCAGTAVTYTASITGGGSVPGYKWIVNGTVMASGSSFVYTPANGDSIGCMLISSYACASPAAISSATIKMTVNPLVVPAISIVASPGDTLCTGTSAIFNATILNGGASPAYQWYVNGAAAGTGTTTYTYTPSNADIVYCALTGSAPCSSPSVVSSNAISMTVDTHTTPAISLSGITSVAAFGTVTVTATVSGTGGSYVIHWLNYGVEFAVTAIPSVIYTKIKDVDSITARIVVTSGSCVDSSTSEALVVNKDFTEVKTIGNNGGISIYPNPAHDDMTIVAPENVSCVTIVNLVGQTVYCHAYNEATVHLNVSNIPTNVYFLKITDSYGEKTVYKFIKK